MKSGFFRGRRALVRASVLGTNGEHGRREKGRAMRERRKRINEYRRPRAAARSEVNGAN